MEGVGWVLFLSFSRKMRWPRINRPAMMGAWIDASVHGSVDRGATLWARISGAGLAKSEPRRRGACTYRHY